MPHALTNGPGRKLGCAHERQRPNDRHGLRHRHGHRHGLRLRRRYRPRHCRC